MLWTCDCHGPSKTSENGTLSMKEWLCVASSRSSRTWLLGAWSEEGGSGALEVRFTVKEGLEEA